MSDRDTLEPIRTHIEQTADVAAYAFIFIGLVGITACQHIVVDEMLSCDGVSDRKTVGDVERQKARRLIAITVGDFEADLEVLVVGALGIGERAGLDIGIAAIGVDGQREDDVAGIPAGRGVDRVAGVVPRGAVG